MIHKEQKKWFLYSTLPKSVNKLFIYMPTQNCPECEKALGELTEYLKGRLDTIGKVSRIDFQLERSLFDSKEERKYPILMFENHRITHDLFDIVNKVDSYLPKYELVGEIENKLKALKDGQDLL